MDVMIANRAFRVVDCYKCGVVFAMPQILDETAHRDKQNFFCPNGHDQQYVESSHEVIAKLRVDVAEALAARDRAEANLARVDKGICPKCNRTFQNLARHMKSKHRR